ncbi:MAG: chloride channel protein [Planctomycetes bacterium]|nr:chloride channel protein [Planctomycetota bacterium]
MLGPALAPNSMLLVIAAAIGIISALANYAFYGLIRAFHLLFVDWLGTDLLGAFADPDRLYVNPPQAWAVVLVPLAGACVLFPIAKLFPGEVYGYGMPRFLERVNLKDARLPARNIAVKMFSAAITVGSGGSAGKEGPVVQIGGTVGSVAASLLRMSTERRRLLVGCGAAAAIASAFDAPIAGVLFAVEIILIGAFELHVFSMLIVAAAAGVAFTRGVLHIPGIFGNVPRITFPEGWTLLAFIGLGVAVGLAAWAYNTMFHRLGRLWKNWKLNQHVKLFIGAALVGLSGIGVVAVLGDGATWIAGIFTVPVQDLGDLVGRMSLLVNNVDSASSVLIVALLGIALLKMLTTATTLGSGGAGGVFGPALFVGGILGTAYGLIIHKVFPGMPVDVRPYTLVGMCAFLSASTHAPLTSIFLLFEVTGRAEAVVPILFASIIGTVISHRLNRESIDTLELADRNVNLHLSKEERLMVLTPVSEVMRGNPERVNQREPLRPLIARMLSSREQYFPVVDDQGKLTGIIGLNDIKQALAKPESLDFLIAIDVATTNVTTVRSDDNLKTALQRLSFRGYAELPVVDADGKLLGMVGQQDVINAYNRRVLNGATG